MEEQTVTDTRDFDELKVLGSGRAAPDEVARLYHQARFATSARRRCGAGARAQHPLLRRPLSLPKICAGRVT
jgi:hypothetical protein